MKPVILLTGGTGFIGSHFIWQCHDSYEIIALARPKSDTSKIQDYCQIAHYDGSLESIAEVFARGHIDGVVHLAACVQSGANSPSALSSLIGANITLGTQLAESAASYPVGFFINALSYFQFANSACYHPFNLYAATKQAFYDICAYYADTLPTTFAHLLIYDTYGEHDPRAKIFTLWKKIAKSGESLDMSDGTQVLDICHVADVVRGICVLIDHVRSGTTPTNHTYTLESSNRFTIRELAALFEQCTQTTLSINWGARAGKAIKLPFRAPVSENLASETGGGGGRMCCTLFVRDLLRLYLPLDLLPNPLPYFLPDPEPLPRFVSLHIQAAQLAA